MNRDEEISLKKREAIEKAKEQLKKINVKTDDAKQLREALKSSCDEHELLKKETEQLRQKKSQLEHELKLVEVKISANEAKSKLIRFIARDQRDAWLKEVNDQTRNFRIRIGQGSSEALEEVFGNCFSEDGLDIPHLTFKDQND